MSREPWPRSKTANIGNVIGATVLGGQKSTSSDAEIQAIADMMDDTHPRIPSTSIPLSPSQSGIVNITPEMDAQRMIQNYVKNNGGIILD